MQVTRSHLMRATVTRDTVIRLLPPLICDEMQIDAIVARVARLLSLDRVR